MESMIKKNIAENFMFGHNTQLACIQFNMARNYIQTVQGMLSFNRKINLLKVDDAKQYKENGENFCCKRTIPKNFDFFFGRIELRLFVFFQFSIVYCDIKHSPFTLQKKERKIESIIHIHTYLWMRYFFLSFQSRKIRSISILFPKQYLFTHFI